MIQWKRHGRKEKSKRRQRERKKKIEQRRRKKSRQHSGKLANGEFSSFHRNDKTKTKNGCSIVVGKFVGSSLNKE